MILYTPDLTIALINDYGCEFGKRWERVKDKYGLRYSSDESLVLNVLAEIYSQEM